MADSRPIVGITMGDPVGIGPEIILLSLCRPSIYKTCRPLVIGDLQILNTVKKCTQSDLNLNPINDPDGGKYKIGAVDVLNLSSLDPDRISWGKPTIQTGKAMIRYIKAATGLAIKGDISAITTCPINKAAMQTAGFHYNGHTELLAEQTRSENFAMMFVGDRLRVVLVTIHVPLKEVPSLLSIQKVLNTIRITDRALYERFGFETPRIAVAGLNPHAGEEGLFGNEEKNVIAPAVQSARDEGFDVAGPLPADTLFYHAAKGAYDAVISMYHDQGMIPFKLIHFNDGVNTTLGLPIIRTSVDHGTAYDIAGTGKADPGSLIAAIILAAKQAARQFKQA